jgi:hypothetical protein
MGEACLAKEIESEEDQEKVEEASQFVALVVAA